MQVSKETLLDLDIFNDLAQGDSLFSLVNTTITDGGRKRLREKFLHLPDSLAALAAQQRCISFLAGQPELVGLVPKNYRMKLVEEYRSLNILGVKGGNWLEALLYGIMAQSEYQQLKYRLLEIPAFLSQFVLVLAGQAELRHYLQAMGHDLDFLDCGDGLGALMPLFRRPVLKFQARLQADWLLRSRLKDDLSSAVSLLYELDALLAMARAGQDRGWACPVFTDSPGPLFRAAGLHHPLIPAAVPSDLGLGRETNLMFLTGPNMAGKTSFLKAVGIACFLAHAGMGAPVLSLELSWQDCLVSSLNVSDNVALGYSFFFSEVQRIKQLATLLAQGRRVLALMDELFRGTNVQDAFEASAQVIAGLAPWRDSLFVVSSHLWEVAGRLGHLANVSYACFEGQLDGEELRFGYRLQPGISQMRLGLAILRREGVLELLGNPPEPAAAES